jgi:hypothetical protein
MGAAGGVVSAERLVFTVDAVLLGGGDVSTRALRSTLDSLVLGAGFASDAVVLERELDDCVVVDAVAAGRLGSARDTERLEYLSLLHPAATAIAAIAA